jgi:hypothetical protein
MRGVLTIIPVGDGAVSSKELAAPPALAALQRGVGGGTIEVVPYFTRYDAEPGYGPYKGEPCVAFCNEEGKLNGLPINFRATALWHAQEPRFIGRDVLVGPIVIVTGDRELMEEL